MKNVLLIALLLFNCGTTQINNNTNKQNHKIIDIKVEYIMWGCKCPNFCLKEAKARENDDVSKCLVLKYDKQCSEIDWHLNYTDNNFILTGYYLPDKVEYPTNAHKLDRGLYPAFYVTKWEILKPYNKWSDNGKTIKIE